MFNALGNSASMPCVQKMFISLLQESMCTKNNYFFTTGFDFLITDFDH